jgi:hypothetical protein
VDVRLLLGLGALLAAPSAWAGDHLSVCAKVHRAQVIVEAEFTPRGGYSKALADKGWGPSARALARTRTSGKVIRVFKGEATVGADLPSEWPVDFTPGNPRVRQWQRFFERKRFRQLLYLSKRGTQWRRITGAEESAGCQSSAHRSWCAGYDGYLAALEACLGSAVSPAALRAACASPCNGPWTKIAVWRDAHGRVQRLRHRGDLGVCSHPPDTYYDGAGVRLLTVAERPVGPEEAAALAAERGALLAGLTAAESLTCPPPTAPTPRESESGGHPAPQ